VDTFSSMTELMDRVPAHKNYSFHINQSNRSRIKLFAPHGGCIEPCTGPIAVAIGMNLLDYFVFSGKRASECFKMLHVTSTHYDEPHCLQMVGEAELAIAIHGCEGNDNIMYIGGGNKKVSASAYRFFIENGYRVESALEEMKGEDKRNFINRARYQGVQFELSAGFRRNLFPSFPKSIQRHPQEFPKFVRHMHSWINHVEQTFISKSNV